MLCTVIELDTKFVTVIDNRVLGTSRHKDYSLFHFKARDVKALKVPLSKFIFVNAKAEVDEVIPAEQLAARGVNYKTAKRDTAELTDVELAEVSGAIELALAAPSSVLKPKPEADAKPSAARTPADGVPKVIITAEAAATGLGELLAQAEATHADSSESDEGESAVGAIAGSAEAATAAGLEAAPGDGTGDLAEGEEDVAGADDPLATVKPSRKKRRR